MTEQRVYVVDDEEAVRRSLGFLLRTSGYQASLFASGTEFLREARGLEPGCVLLDVRMPEMDGLEVQREMAARGITLPVIVLTGHGDITTAVQAMKAGAVDFLEKPFEKAALLTALEAGFARVDQVGEGADAARPPRANATCWPAWPKAYPTKPSLMILGFRHVRSRSTAPT